MAHVVAGAATDVGRVRVVNEDSFLSGARVWVVADGMGGHAAGDVASRLAVESLAELDGAGDLLPARVNAAVARANASVVRYGMEHLEARGLGTTVAGLVEVVIGGVPHWAVFNVGDSRVYRYAGGELKQASIDHSEVEELLEAGLIDAEQARDHPARHLITRALGMLPTPAVDLWVLPRTPGERFLLCSDGLNSELDDDQIAAVLDAHPDASDAAGALVAAVLATPARDNVTVLVIDPGPDDQDDEDPIAQPLRSDAG